MSWLIHHQALRMTYTVKKRCSCHFCNMVFYSSSIYPRDLRHNLQKTVEISFQEHIFDLQNMKVIFYPVVAISTLFCGWQTQTLNRQYLKQLQCFHQNKLHTILRKDPITKKISTVRAQTFYQLAMISINGQNKHQNISTNVLFFYAMLFYDCYMLHVSLSKFSIILCKEELSIIK